MVRTLNLNLLLQNQECFKAESYMDSMSNKFVQMMTRGFPMHLYGETVEKSFSQNVLKSNG